MWGLGRVGRQIPLKPLSPQSIKRVQTILWESLWIYVKTRTYDRTSIDRSIDFSSWPIWCMKPTNSSSEFSTIRLNAPPIETNSRNTLIFVLLSNPLIDIQNVKHFRIKEEILFIVDSLIVINISIDLQRISFKYSHSLIRWEILTKSSIEEISSFDFLDLVHLYLFNDERTRKKDEKGTKKREKEEEKHRIIWNCKFKGLQTFLPSYPEKVLY